MKSKQTMFFATKSDIDPILKYLEDNSKIQYFLTGLLESRNVPNYKSAIQIPNLAFVQKGDWNQIESYLVIPANDNIHIRDVPQRAGGTMYAVDQLINLKSVELKIGGILKEGILVAGRVATISEDDFSIRQYRLISSAIKKRFTRIGTFYVGKEAEQKLKSGWRLVTNEKSPKEYDLAYED